MDGIDRSRLQDLLDDERRRFLENHRRSRALRGRSAERLLGGVPMGWMRWWPTPIPLIIEEAIGAHLRDIDGHEYIDFCLGEGGSMAGHSPFDVASTVARQSRNGLSHLFATEDAVWVVEDLTRRFGVSMWHFALSATDANRFVLRLLRALTERPNVLVFDGCYHGTIDEGLHLAAGEREPARRIVPFNDLEALEATLAPVTSPAS